MKDTETILLSLMQILTGLCIEGKYSVCGSYV